jgi:hypothetical protein
MLILIQIFISANVRYKLVSTSSDSISLTSILILFSHLRPDFTSGYSSSRFPNTEVDRTHFQTTVQIYGTKFFLWRSVPQQMLQTHRSLKAYCATLRWRWRERWSYFFIFPSNGAKVKWNWQGKTEVLGEKPVLVPLCPPQIPHGMTRDRTRASAVGGWWLTMARPSMVRNYYSHWVLKQLTSNWHVLWFCSLVGGCEMLWEVGRLVRKTAFYVSCRGGVGREDISGRRVTACLI